MFSLVFKLFFSLTNLIWLFFVIEHHRVLSLHCLIIWRGSSCVFLSYLIFSPSRIAALPMQIFTPLSFSWLLRSFVFAGLRISLVCTKSSLLWTVWNDVLLLLNSMSVWQAFACGHWRDAGLRASTRWCAWVGVRLYDVYCVCTWQYLADTNY